jgi:hypothetical protein
MTDLNQGPSGGTGGDKVDIAIPQAATIHAVQVYVGNEVGTVINAVTFFFHAEDGTEKSITIGALPGGTAQERVDLAPNQSIRDLFGSYDAYVHRIGFTDNTGLLLGEYGQDTNQSQPFEYVIPGGAQLVGFHGRSGAWIDAFGVKYRNAS